MYHHVGSIYKTAEASITIAMTSAATLLVQAKTILYWHLQQQYCRLRHQCLCPITFLDFTSDGLCRNSASLYHNSDGLKMLAPKQCLPVIIIRLDSTTTLISTTAMLVLTPIVLASNSLENQLTINLPNYFYL
jgi:hypothetical protein